MNDSKNQRQNPQVVHKHHTREEWIWKFQTLGGKCHYCGVQLTAETVTKDHLTPTCRGGSDEISNVVPACMPCNSKKAWRTEAEFREVLPRLSTRSVTIPNPKPCKLAPEETHEPGLLKKIVIEREQVSWAWRNPA